LAFYARWQEERKGREQRAKIALGCPVCNANLESCEVEFR